MKKDLAVQLTNVSKVYRLYDKPIDRLKESLHPLKKKYHKDFYALKNINLEIKKGEVLGIVGVNGAGKSTLLKIISGVLTPTTGRINVHGRINAILELGSALKPEMTGRENIKLNLQINGIEKDREKLTQEMIEFADIGEHIDQPIKSYSSGMKARLGFAIATSTDPDILIVDEVLAVGDVLFQRKCYSIIEKLFKDGKTVIFVSHSAQSVIEFCSRAVLLYDREIIMDDAPKNVTDYYQKLVFSKDKKKVVDEINSQTEVPNKKEKLEHTIKLIKNKQKAADEINFDRESTINNIKNGVEKKSDYFLTSLTTNPKYVNIELASFKNIKISTASGMQVNVLKIGNDYLLSFNVVFHKHMENVIFGCQFKNLKGIVVSGANSKISLENSITFNIKQDEIYHVQMKFKCLLLPGDYFVRLSALNDSHVSLVEDSLIFKVAKEKWQQSGVAYLSQDFVIEQIKE